MALPLSNTFEGGSDETAITSGNSGGGSGTAFDTVEGTVTFDTARAAHGTLSARLDVVNAVCNVQWRSTAIETGITEMWSRHYVYLTANPANTLRHVVFANASLARCGSFEILSTGKIRMSDSAFTSQDTTNSVPLNEWARIECRLLASATVGQMEVRLFSGDSTSAIETSATPANRNTLADIRLLGVGQLTSNTQTTTLWVDDFAGGKATWIGPAATAGAAGQFFALLGVG